MSRADFFEKIISGRGSGGVKLVLFVVCWLDVVRCSKVRGVKTYRGGDDIRNCRAMFRGGVRNSREGDPTSLCKNSG